MKKSGKGYIITIIVKSFTSREYYVFYIIYFSHCWINMNANNIEVTFYCKVYINNLPLNIPEANVDVYADDRTLWKSGDKCIKIQNDLQSSLNCANVWFEQNHMKPNIKKTKHFLIGTHQKLRRASISSLKLNLNGTAVEAVNEKLLGVKLDRNLSWNDHVDYLMKKLNSRISC